MFPPKHRTAPSAALSGGARQSRACLRPLLLGGSALCGVAAVLVGVATRAANILPTQGATNLAVPIRTPGSLAAKTLVGGVVTPGTINYTSSGVAATVTLAAPRTLIDWTTFEVGPGNALTFNFANNTDIVLNRVAGGSISVDPGGAVNGTVGLGGPTGGNLWFIAPNGVFLHGTVTASGVLATNNASLADLNLLSDSVTTLKGELAAAGSLFDFEGSVTATDASIDALGDLILNGDVNTGPAGTVDLVATGTITQTAGVITATTLTGSSGGATALTDQNLFDTLPGFANTGSGGVSIVDAQPTGLTVTGAVTVAAGSTLSLTTTGGPLTIAASQTLSGGALNLASGASLAINAPVTVDGATAVSLSYNSDSPTGLSFGNGAALTYANADGSPATASAGGSLSINDQPYTLLYKLALPGSTGPDTGLDDVAGIDANNAAGGDEGVYALAVNLAGTGSPTAPQFISTLAGAGENNFSGAFNGLGHTITNLTINDASDQYVGLFGQSAGFVSNIGLVGGSLTANAASIDSGVPVFAGGLIGASTGSVINAYAGASVTATGGGGSGGFVGVGGLVGGNTGQITQSYATGPVANTGVGAASIFVGGLVGTTGVSGSTFPVGAITAAYATGSVTGESSNLVGGLVGYNNSTITEAYATGVVFGSGIIGGGLVGYNDTVGTISAAAFDTETTGQGLGIGVNLNSDGTSVASLTTAQFQTGGLPGGFDPTVWSGGTGGLYPFLTTFYPAGVQAVSGRIEGLVGNPPYSIGLIGGGTDIAVASAGADDTYYAIAPAGTLTAGESLLAYSIGPFAAVSLSPATGATTQTGFNVYAPALVVPTAATTLSAAPTLAQAQALALTEAGSNAVALNDIASVGGLGLLATGPSFTIDQPVTANTFGVVTGPGAPLTVAAPIVMTGEGALGLLSGGALTIDAPVVQRGAGLIGIFYDASSPTNLTFGAAGSISFANADGSPATTSQGGVLTINEHAFTLLYTLALPGSTGPDTGLEDIAGIDNNAFAGQDAGDYALATNVTGTGSITAPQFVGPLAGQSTGYFTGVFEGLGNTVTNLTINNPINGISTGEVATGLFGYSRGVIRDIGLVGGSVVGAADASVGEVVGASYGIVVGASATGSVSAGANSNIGVVVGFNDGLVTESNAAGSASGAGTNSAIGGVVGGQDPGGSIIQSFATTAVSGGGTLSDIGGLVGNNNGSVAQSYATGPVNETGFNSNAGGLAGNNGGSVSGSFATGAVADTLSGSVGGLVGDSDTSSAISASYATGAVSGVANSNVGGLVGFNDGVISQSSYSGVVSDPGSAAVGGLVGDNDTTGAITQSQATGTVTAGAGALAGGLAGYNTGAVVEAMAQVAVEDNQTGVQVGGLVGYNDTSGSLTLTIATGPVNGGPNSDVGGLVGHNLGLINNGLATGAVSGGSGSTTGGFVGHNDVAGTILASAFDTQTTGQTISIGLDSNPVGMSGAIEAATTAQLQTPGLPTGFDPDVWSGGTGGLYPYLDVFFPTGLQAVSGVAYSDAGITPLASGVNGAVSVGVVDEGDPLGGAFTGANGYYYIAARSGSFAPGDNLLVNTAPGPPGAATLSSASGDLNQSGLNLYGGAVTLATTAPTLSTAPTLAQAQAQALAVAGGDTDAQNAIRAATGLGLILLGSTFTVDQPVTTSSTLVIETGLASLLAVDAPISLHVGGSLGLLSSGELAINAPITANGGPIGVNLTYDTSQQTNLSFGAGAAVTFANADGSVATSSQGGYLAINGRAYTLLYNLAQPGSSGPDNGLDDIAGIDANTAAGGDAGLYALATNVAGTGTASSPQFASGLVGAVSGPFTGVFEGLGHTVTDLTISDSTNMYVGLFGGSFGATVRDIGLVGGSVNGRAATAVGALIGDNEGLTVNTYSGAAVTDGRAFSDVGGLVGQNGGTILNSFATGAVTGGANGEAGGLAGDSGGSIIQSFAAGAVTVGANGEAGGLLGSGDGSVTQGYATGAVSGGTGATVGGLVGVVELAATVTAAAFDSVTTGQSSAFGFNADPSGASAVGLTTAQFQSGPLPVGFSIDVWGGAPGLYPYLLNAFPTGVQAVSGIAYSDMGVTPLASGASGAVTVGLTANGAPVGTATTGANGYYYIFAPAGTVTAGESLIAATIAGAPMESDTYTATGAVAQTGVNIYYSPPPGIILPTQGAVNLAIPTNDGSLATNILVGGVETPGIAGYVSTGPTATVTLTASRTLIDWTTFEVGAGDTLNFDFTGSASDIVLNRVVGGAISVDSGGSVNGFFDGAPGGNIWFLASNGVFLHGAVAAGGVLASNNTGVPDLNLLSDNLSTLQGELATGASLIDLAGAVTVTGATIDGSGNLVLGGDVDTGAAGSVDLASTGTITQTGGVITASTLDSASSGATTLTDQNQVATLGASSTGAGTLAFTNAFAAGLTIGGAINTGAGDVDITTTAPDAPLTLAANLTTDSAHAVSLVSAGPIVQASGIITTSTVSGSSVGGTSLTGANLFSNLGPLTNLDASDVTILDALPSGLTVTGALDAGAGNSLNLITTAGPLTLAADVSAAGGAVTLVSFGAIGQTAGVITTGTLTGTSVGGARLTDANQIATLAGFTNADSGPISLTDAQSLAITGVVDNVPVVLTAGVGRDIAIDVTSGNLTAAAPIAAVGDVALQAVSGSLTVSTISSGDDVVLAAGQGAVSLGGPVTAVGTAAQGAGLALFNAISGPLDGLFTLGEQSLFIEARTFSNAGGLPLTAGNAIGVSLSDPAGLNLANANPGVGSWVQTATLLAPSVTLFEGVGNLNVVTATIGSPINSLSLYAANFVQVTGLFAPAADNTVNLTIGSATTAAWAPSQIDVVNDGGGSPNHGSIGYETIVGSGTYGTAPLTFHSASLYATSNILMGTSAFVAANAAVTGAGLLLTNPSTPVPTTAANNSLTVLLAADNASLAAGSQIVQQNTAGLATNNGAGTYVTGVLTLGAYGGSPPPAIDLFGVFAASGPGAPVTGQAAAASSQIVLSGSLASSPYRNLYRFNGCAIGVGGCLTVSSTALSVVNNVANQGILLSIADIGAPEDPQNADDESGSDGSADAGAGPGVGGGQRAANSVNAGEAAFQDDPFSALGQRAIHPQINMSYVIRNGFLRFEDTDLEDLTITGAPNEEVWRKPEVRP
jgi:filamentous hemagglutinin family protein